MAKAPRKILLHKKSKTLELHFGADGGAEPQNFTLPAEYLRVYSPSAEVKGHSRGQEVLQTGKLHVGIESIQAQGNYAIRIIFDDNHDSGIYSWEYLYDLGINQQQRWRDYLQRLEEAGQSRDPGENVVKFV